MKFITIELQVDPSSIDKPPLTEDQVKKICKIAYYCARLLDRFSFVRWAVYNDEGKVICLNNKGEIEKDAQT